MEGNTDYPTRQNTTETRRRESNRDTERAPAAHARHRTNKINNFKLNNNTFLDCAAKRVILGAAELECASALEHCPARLVRREGPRALGASAASSRGEQTAVATRSGSARRWRPGLRLTASTGGHGRPSEAGSASAWTTCLKQGSACRKVVVMFVIMALKNLRRRDLRPKGPDHNHGELAPRITRLAWARPQQMKS